MAKIIFQMWLKLRVLRWGDYPGLSLWTQCKYRVLSSKSKAGKSETEKKQCDDRSRLQGFVAAVRKGAMSQGMWIASRSRKRQRDWFLSKASGQNMALPTPDFSQWNSFWTSGLQKYKTKFVLFSATKFVIISYSTNRKLIQKHCHEGYLLCQRMLFVPNVHSLFCPSLAENI